MKLNKIQKTIYEEYIKNGKVWAECPRQSGKTELILFILKEEMKKGKTVMVRSVNPNQTRRIKNLINVENKSLLVKDEECAEVILYDEIYYDILKQPNNKKIVCLRTPQHKTLRFNYKDLPFSKQKIILEKKKTLTEEQFQMEYELI